MGLRLHLGHSLYSHNAETHLLDWADGILSAPHVRRHMMAAFRDGSNHSLVTRIAQMGGEGSVPNQNVHRDMIRMLQKIVRPFITVISQPLTYQCWVKPSTTLALVGKSVSNMESRLGACEDKLLMFWTHLFSSERGQQFRAAHPFLQGRTPWDLRRSVPLTIHEDAGPYRKSGSVNVLSFASILGIGTEQQIKYLICSAVKEKKADVDAKLWGLLLDNFDALATEGFRDAGGRQWWGILCFGKADLEVCCQSWGVPHYAAADENCMACLANRGVRNFSDLRPRANWRGTEGLSELAWRFRLAGDHPLTNSRYFTSHFVRLDVMHVADCKGMTATIAGSVLRPLAHGDPRLGANQAERLEFLTRHRKEHESRHPGCHRF